MTSSYGVSVPLRIPAERVRFYGTLLIALPIALWLLVRFFWNMDLALRNWQNFQSAGATAGTPALLDPAKHTAWQQAHHLMPQVFAYPPAVAWFYMPFAHISATAGLICNAACVVVLSVFAALLAARVFALGTWFAILAVFAWQPALDSTWTGENGAITLALAMVVVWAIASRKPTWAGVATGAMLFKPSIAVAFVLLLVARREWRALGVVAGFAGIWYFASVAATAGDWVWPAHYIGALRAYYASDFKSFAVAAMSLPAILLRLGVPAWVSLGAAALLLVGSTVLFYRRPALESASVAGLVAAAASPHAWGYDAALVLPSLFFVMKSVSEPWRTRIVVFAYVAAAAQVFATIQWGVNPLAIVLICGMTFWIVHCLLEPARLQMCNGNRSPKAA